MAHTITRPRRGIGDIVPLRVPGGHDLPGPGAPQQRNYGGGYGTPAQNALAQTPGIDQPYGIDPALEGAPSTFGSPIFQTNPWAPASLVPDHMLPPALKRIAPDRGPFYLPNHYDQDLLGEAYTWKWIAEHGGLKTCCRIPELGAPIWEQPPWQVMPSQGIELQEMFALPIGSVSGGPPFDGTDTIIGSYQVPKGYDGAIVRFVAQAPGVQGFNDFSGDITWRLKYGTRYAKGLGNVKNTYGSFTNALLIPGISIRVISGQTIEVIASIPNGAALNGGYVAGGVWGWIYPRR